MENLRRIEEISIMVRAKNIVFHPEDLPPVDILKKFSFSAITENMVPRKKVSSAMLKDIMERYDIGLCLDASHAYLHSPAETKIIIGLFHDRIRQVHFSATYRKKDHLSLKNAGEDFIRSVQPLKELDVPIIIEEDIREKSMQLLKEEVVFARRILGN